MTKGGQYDGWRYTIVYGRQDESMIRATQSRLAD